MECVLIIRYLICVALKLRAGFGACPAVNHNTNLLHVAKNLRCCFQISTLALIVYAKPFRSFTFSLPYEIPIEGYNDLWPHLLMVSVYCHPLIFLCVTGHVMHQQFNVQQLYALPTLYLCVLYLSENKQRLVLLTT
jgi:hypothetical protein